MDFELDDIQDDEAFERLLENIVDKLSAYLNDLGDMHVIDGELTDIPALPFDSIH